MQDDLISGKLSYPIQFDSKMLVSASFQFYKYRLQVRHIGGLDKIFDLHMNDNGDSVRLLLSKIIVSCRSIYTIKMGTDGQTVLKLSS